MECLELSKAKLGVSHANTLSSMNNLAVLYESQGKYDQAEPLLVECLELRKAIGVSHPDTLVSMNNLAGLYYYLW